MIKRGLICFENATKISLLKSNGNSANGPKKAINLYDLQIVEEISDSELMNRAIDRFCLAQYFRILANTLFSDSVYLTVSRVNGEYDAR